MAPHELRFLGDNVTLTRSQWETLREQMRDHAPDAKRIDEMLSEPRHWRGVEIVSPNHYMRGYPDAELDHIVGEPDLFSKSERADAAAIRRERKSGHARGSALAPYVIAEDDFVAGRIDETCVPAGRHTVWIRRGGLIGDVYVTKHYTDNADRWPRENYFHSAVEAIGFARDHVARGEAKTAEREAGKLACEREDYVVYQGEEYVVHAFCGPDLVALKTPNALNPITPSKLTIASRSELTRADV